MKNRVVFAVVLLFWVIAAPGWSQSREGSESSREAVSGQSPGQGEEEFVDPFEKDPFDDKPQELRIADPIEPINRGIFWFNDKLYFYCLKPVARVFRVVPEPARTAVDRFFSNLGTPVRFANALLQLKVKDAGTEAGRFVLNTTVGMGGFLDPAKTMGMAKKEEDFGQTLGYYGVGHGCYLVLPLFGSSSLRDGTGRVADNFLDPQTYLLTPWWRLGGRALDTVNFLSLDKDSYESIKKAALDPYLFLRNAYAQRRQGLINK
ncbi:MAG: VacJ family lipoprotein [Deltaproteobacteria bacterium]|nr:VacJ family lipoprotein [Deltaproteobacteria bacterium]